MFEAHPDTDELDRFLRNASPPGGASRNGQVVRHLLAECAVCWSYLDTVGWDRSRIDLLLRTSNWEARELEAAVTGIGLSYGKAFLKTEATVAAYFGSDLPSDQPIEILLADLASLPEPDQIEAVSREHRFAKPQIVRKLVEQSQATRYRDPNEMLHLADLARLVSEVCAPASTGNELRLADLKTRAWGQLGNALRVSGRLRDAEEAYTTAQSYQKSGTGDPALRAWLIEKVTSLHIFQGRLESAFSLSEEAGQIYRELGETHLLASTLVQKAIVSLYAGDTESGVRILNHAIPLIDHEEDPHLLLAACHNLVRAYIDLDRPEQALAIYSEARQLYREFGENTILLRAGWQEGQLLRDLGHLRAAEEALLRARRGFLERDLAYEVALVSLDLAAVYVKLRLVPELKETVTTTVPIFRALCVSREALGSLLQLQQVADQELQALELIRLLNVSIGSLPKRNLSKDR